ncbi:glycoside hydrolase family 127 protein [Flavobacterium silvaticum]|uniref:Glycoside hydrolase family 127 protein n=1 Tax=Flavobacterium silvaticum TaxID=1852020 RepID=A0A972FNQ6_9FLAO|nr:glycoside hydrolase family 127 protein [Flavobacterium silvaticum]NMH28615.1 glycoside hydrolase family 127 protein [Flavobacterium silvaticum]
MTHLFKIGITICAAAFVGFITDRKAETSADVPGYPIEAVPIKDVKITDEFWLPIIKRVQEKTIPYAIKKCADEGRLDNFLIAGGKMKGSVKGQMPFDDTDVYKIIEGASNSLISNPNPKLEKTLDSIIAIIKIGQEKDGYLTTWRTINPAKPPAPWVKVVKGERWEYMNMSHEDYNAGHLYEAAAVHFKATGKRNFLDIALKNADLFVKTFGDGPGKRKNVPGHQIIETGLIKLYDITGKKEYLELSRFFLDNRGHHEHRESFGEYAQDSIPVIDQKEAVGHAVRATYMYAGMTDIAAIYKDEAYKKAVNALWHNMTEKKTYLTGGIGAIHWGERFSTNYHLPNLTAYNETCAAIGSVYWNNRMFNLTGDVKYNDVIERTLYNAVISGISLTGTEFFYPNPLESDGEFDFNRGACTRSGWFDCSCCPTNLIRFIPALPGMIYATQKDTLYVNQYMSNTAKAIVGDRKIQLAQKTQYPWNGNVSVSIDPNQESRFSVKFRVPGWARNEVLPGDLYTFANEQTAVPTISINGTKSDVKITDGYFTITRNWKKGDVVTLDFPMEVRQVKANPKVEEDREKFAIEYGPLVYAVEEKDNVGGIGNFGLSKNTKFTRTQMPQMLGGIFTIEAENRGKKFTAIPYYAWSNRGANEMKVWLHKIPE